MTVRAMSAVTQDKEYIRKEEVSIPALHNGDHLTLAEFERRYAAQPYLKKAELIEGVVYVPSPVSLEHSKRHAVVMGWLLNYQAATPGLQLLDNATVVLDAENEVQPDAALCIVKGGQTEVVGNFLHGAPELVVEIANSSAAYDLHEKLRVYRRTGVQEYVIFLTLERETLWYRLVEGRYEPVEASDDNLIRSAVFPGLSLDVTQFWADDLPGLLETLQRGLRSDEHKAFIQSITSAT